MIFLQADDAKKDFHHFWIYAMALVTTNRNANIRAIIMMNPPPMLMKVCAIPGSKVCVTIIATISPNTVPKNQNARTVKILIKIA